MNTIEKLGDDETFRQIVERSIASFEDNELTEVAKYSFYNCDKLASVIIPNATTLGEYAFSGCVNLNSLNLLKVTSMGSKAFYECRLLTEISFPLLTTVPSSAFYNCTALATFNLPKVTQISSSAFYNSGLTSANFSLVTSVGDSAFYNCKSLSSVKLPKVKSIGDGAFSNCSSMASIIVGTELDDETAICTLGGTSAFPSSIGAIYVPYNLQDKYKTATNWSSFASKIQGYEQPVACQSLTITADNVAAYQTSTTIHWEATCTYSIEGMMQTGTMVFKGDVASDTFEKNPSSDSNRSIEVSYTFLGKTATTTITQSKYIGDPLGGTIFYIDDTADGVYEFYDTEGNLMPDISVGSTPSYYKVLTAGSKDKYYVYHDEIYYSLYWSNSLTATGATGTAIGTGKSNTAILLATNEVTETNTIWYKLQQIRNASTGGCNDWFIPSKDEVEALRLAVNSGSITGGIIAGSSYAESAFNSKHPWSSSEDSDVGAWYWVYFSHEWGTIYKTNRYPVFFVRAF